MFIFYDDYYSAADLLKKSSAQIVFSKNKRSVIKERMDKCLVI